MVVAVVSVVVFSVFSQDRVQQRLLEQLVLTFQFRSVEVFNVLARDRLQVLHPHSPGVADDAFSHSADSSSSTPAAQLEGFFIDQDGGVRMRLPSGQWTLLGSDQHVIRDEPG